ncbi:LysR family transcriptional regulator [Samsonia erythrinae]|uniref:DNA-binding transcriptional LysR family regulator n=1 Tax=Samsonia erythrinae TaxID=160434 RepID=A0A4R3VTC9_9GAMM|nr:LysR family transcriptional regulator [Samsonia erythrinae]TCV08616.1 DNA-binding transcriptional LysR family regulator [Samsonia erythrinae]
MSTLPPLYALRAFESAARYKSYTLAAEDLSITQSSISKHIKTLENFFGVKLFYRNGPRIMLTPEGEAFARDLEPVFGALSMACKRFSHQDFILYITSPYLFSLRWLIPVLKDFHASVNDITCHLDMAENMLMFVDFEKDNCDGAIQYGDGLFPIHWEVTRLVDEWLVPVCAPSLLDERQKKVRWQDCWLCSALTPDYINIWCNKSGEKFQSKSVRPWMFDSIERTINAAVQGIGTAIVDMNMVAAELQNNMLVIPIQKAVFSGRSYYFVWHNENYKKHSLSEFGRYLKSHIASEDREDIAYIT